MSLEDTEINIGGVKFKGVYIAVVLSIISAAGGVIWTASEFFSRIETLENEVAAIEVPDLSPITEDISNVKLQLENNNVAQLQGKLAELGVTLENIKNRQQEVLTNASLSTAKVQELEKKFISLEKSVEGALEDVEDFQKKVKTFEQEVNDLWKGLDAASSPLG